MGDRKYGNRYYRAGQAIRYVVSRGAPAGLAYAVGSRQAARRGSNVTDYSSATYRSGLSGQGYQGGAAPIPTKSANSYQRKKKRFAKANKCRKMKGMALKKEVCKLSNQIKELQNSESASLGLMTYRQFTNKQLLSAENAQGVTHIAINDTTQYENALANLKYYDPSNPATLLTATAATGSYQKNFLVKNIYSKLKLRNNFQTDAEVTVYLASVKADSSISPTQAWTDGITTDAGNVTAYTELAQFPTDYDVFRDLWSTKRVGHKILSPGQSMECNHSIDNVEYSPALVDEHTATYQSRFKTSVWLVIVKGTIAHDTTQDETGLTQAGVDMLHTRTYKVSYDAGVNLSYVHTVVSMDTPTNGFVQSHQPIPDNIGYSVS